MTEPTGAIEDVDLPAGPAPAAPLPVADLHDDDDSVADLPDEPPEELRYHNRVRPVAAIRELYASRGLVRSLAERELRARYKQAILGFVWAILSPLALMAVFSVFFNRVAKIDTGGIPYPLFAYLGLIPWSFFSTSVSQGGLSLVNNVALLNKVYCPREIFPLASVGVAVVDSSIAVLGLCGLFVIFTEMPHATSYWVPVLLAVQFAFALGVALVVSSVVLFVRDLRHALPLILQLGLFATPVAYGLEDIPADVRPFYVAINPLAAVIDGYRRTVLEGLPPRFGLLGIAAASSFLILGIGYVLFKRLEAGFADIA